MRAFQHNNKIVVAEKMDEDTFVGIDDLKVYKASDFETEKSPEDWASDVVDAINDFTDDEVDGIIGLLKDFNDSIE